MSSSAVIQAGIGDAMAPQSGTGPSSSDIVQAGINDALGRSAVNMVGPNGELLKQVDSSKVDELRSKNFMITPDTGVRMATPQGQLTYAAPWEVDKFKASGHVPIDATGNFRVEPLSGESNAETMRRAATIAKNLPPDVMQRAIEAEKKTFTAKRIAANLAAGPIAGFTGAGLLAGTAEGAGAARAIVGAIAKEGAKQLAGKTAADVAGKVVVNGVKHVVTGAGLGLGGLLTYWLAKAIGGK